MMRRVAIFACALALFGAVPAAAPRVPHYDRIFMIVEENKSADRIVGSDDAPTITALAKKYGYASQFYAESHPTRSTVTPTIRARRAATAAVRVTPTTRSISPRLRA